MTIDHRLNKTCLHFVVLVYGLLSLVYCLSCGGGSYGPAAGNGGLSIIVKTNAPVGTKAAGFGEVKRYRVQIMGGDFEPVEKEFSADATDVVIDGIPKGENRRVMVTTENTSGDVIEEAMAESVKIEGGKTTPLEMTLEAVPVFVNLANKASVDHDRLIFHVFSLTGDPLVIRRNGDPMIDVSLNVPEIMPDENGFAELYAGKMDPGTYPFSVENQRNGKSTAIELYLTDAKGKRGAPLFSGGGTGGNLGGTFLRGK